MFSPNSSTAAKHRHVPSPRLTRLCCHCIHHWRRNLLVPRDHVQRSNFAHPSFWQLHEMDRGGSSRRLGGHVDHICSTSSALRKFGVLLLYSWYAFHIYYSRVFSYLHISCRNLNKISSSGGAASHATHEMWRRSCDVTCVLFAAFWASIMPIDNRCTEFMSHQNLLWFGLVIFSRPENTKP